MAVPHEDYDALVKMWEQEINNPNELICEIGLCIGGRKCSFFEDLLSNLTIIIEDIEFTLMPKGYLLNGQDLDREFADSCIFGIMPLPIPVGQMKMFLLGDTFLRSYYSVFDFDN